MSYRKLRVLLDGLPEESLTWTQVRESMTPQQLAESKATGHGRWSRTNHLLAGILDAVRVGNWQYVASQVKQGQAGAPPQPHSRPGIDDNVIPLTAEAADYMDRYYERLRTNHGSTGEG